MFKPVGSEIWAVINHIKMAGLQHSSFVPVQSNGELYDSYIIQSQDKA